MLKRKNYFFFSRKAKYYFLCRKAGISVSQNDVRAGNLTNNGILRPNVERSTLIWANGINFTTVANDGNGTGEAVNEADATGGRRGQGSELRNAVIDGEDDEEESDDADMYAKSFYEIYNDDKDTYDCPEELLKFIRKEHMNVKIKIKCSSPRNMKKSEVKSVIKGMFKESEMGNEDEQPMQQQGDDCDSGYGTSTDADSPAYYLNSNFKSFSYPDRNVLWPNPLVYNHRLQPFILRRKKDVSHNDFEHDKRNIEINKKRLENLWCYSSSYGIEWNTLDALYLHYKSLKTEHLNEWEKNKNKIMLYSSKVAKRKLINSRKELLNKLNIDYTNNVYANYSDTEDISECNLDDDNTEYNLLLPRSVFRKWTRTLYFYWKDRYMHYYSNTLCDYLKGEVVDLQLLREHNERNLNLRRRKMLSKHSFGLEPVKGSNLYVRRCVKGKMEMAKDDDESIFDLTGVGECIYDSVKKDK
ncbi:conserved Plasmodium protein, unknown function [Plasmodium ovale wallikeri]|uniref:Uncharacterized protein n=1 Tax=Plasmodium ovale wallikeri TaxID=864142 RepID=A0A1A8YJL3_PLAOA|nr:conserved Plasmodium protein, unknown function [Plasmodium ovale wallikeri]SBT31733.1 conserved Plasmodium protein, unknown function [Plasmodium ovale wallikeri]